MVILFRVELGICYVSFSRGSQLGYWVQRVGHEFDPVILVSPMENN